MTLRPLLALAALVLAVPTALAQWHWEASAEAGAERAGNLLRAPDVLLAEDAVRDSVTLDDVILPLGGDVTVGRAWGPHAVSLRYDLALQRHRSAGYLDGEDHAVRLRAETERGPLEARAEGRWQRVERVGIHVLGDVRPQLFRYAQPEARGRLRWTPAAAHRLTLEGRAYRRTYDERGGTPLDHATVEAEAAWRVRRREARRTRWSLEATVGARDRAYRVLRARAADGARDDAHPANRLRYLDAGLDARLAVTPTLSLAAGAAVRLRQDRFAGYYSYRAHTLDAALAWAPRRGLAVEAGGRYRRLDYRVQRAPQAADGPEPLLAYDYLGWSVSATAGAGRGVQLAAYAEGTRRGSNVTRETLLRRRAYGVSAVGLRVEVDLRRAIVGAD